MAWGRYTGHRKSREKDSLWRIERVRRFDLATSRKRINSNSRLLSFTTFNNTGNPRGKAYGVGTNCGVVAGDSLGFRLKNICS